MKLAQNIRENRERLGLSQGELAKAVFVSRQTVSNWETGRTYPDVQSLLLLSRRFGVSVDSPIEADADGVEEALAAGSRRMSLLGIVMAVFAIACAAWVLASIALDLSMAASVVPAAALLVPAAITAAKIEKMRRDHQLFTYQSAAAFMAGKDPDVLNRFNQRAGEHWVRNRVLKTVVAVIVGVCCGWGIASMIAKLLNG